MVREIVLQLYAARGDETLQIIKRLLKGKSSDEIKSIINSVHVPPHYCPLITVALNAKNFTLATYLIEEHNANHDIMAKSGISPLWQGASHGNLPFVKLCFERNMNVDIGGRRISRSPLYVAAANGHLDVVKFLVENGADIHNIDNDRNTCLMAACRCTKEGGNLDVVKYLVENGANLDAENLDRHTCYTVVCYINSESQAEIVRYLLSKKTGTILESICDKLLHKCVKLKNLPIIKVLVEHGAVMQYNYQRLTPLLTAAIDGEVEIVNYFVSLPRLASRKDKIDALELLGVTLIPNDLPTALKCWKRALSKRYNSKCNVISKPRYPPIPALNNVQEFRNIKTLNAIADDQYAIYMHALAIIYRILGFNYKSTLKFCLKIGQFYAQEDQFQRSFELWHFAIAEVRKQPRMTIHYTQRIFGCFLQVFMYTITNGIIFDTQELLKVLHSLIGELRCFTVIAMYNQADGFIEDEEDDKILSYYMCLDYAIDLTYLIMRQITDNSDEYMKLRKKIFVILRDGMVNSDSCNFFQMMINRSTPFVGQIVSPRLIRLYLAAGADPNAADIRGNTALHHVARRGGVCDCVVQILVDAGGRLNAVNKTKETYESLLSVRAKQNRRQPFETIKLMCLAARVVHESCIDISTLPRQLQNFVKSH